MTTTIPPLPAALIPVLPFLSMILTDWLRHSTLPKWLNMLIALIAPLLIASLWGLLCGAFTPDLSADFVLIVALIYAVMALPDLAGLRAWLQDTLTSPFAMVAAISAPADPPTIRRRASLSMHGIELPALTTPHPALRTPLPAPDRQGLLSGPLSPTSHRTEPMAATTMSETSEEPPTTA